MDFLEHLHSRLHDDETANSCFELLNRIYTDCIQYLPDLKLTFISQTYHSILQLSIRYNLIGTYHKAGRWSAVIAWTSKALEFIEKETSADFHPIRDKLIYLLTNAYIKTHDESKGIVCLQLCSDPTTVQFHYLYLLYYIAIHNISFIVIDCIPS